MAESIAGLALGVFYVGRISSTVGYGPRAMESAPAARLVLG